VTPDSPYGRCQLCGAPATAVVAPIVRSRGSLRPAPLEARCARHLRRPVVPGAFVVLSPGGVVTEGARWKEILTESGPAAVHVAHVLMANLPLPVLVADERAGCLQVNRVWERLTGWTMEAGSRTAWLQPFSLTSRHQLREVLRVPRLTSDPSFELATTLMGPNREEQALTVRGSLLPPDGSGRQVWLLTLVEAERGLPREPDAAPALVDLTTSMVGLPLLREHIRHAFERLERGYEGFVVLAVSLTVGPSIDDGLRAEPSARLQRNIARRIRGTLRSSDVACRSADDEYLVLCEEVRTYRDAEALVGRMATAFATPVSLGGRRARVQANFGVAFPHRPADDPDQVLDRARSAAMLARVRGSGGYEIVIGAGDSPLRARHAARN
jgi:GGDEF domain-containing protein